MLEQGHPFAWALLLGAAGAAALAGSRWPGEAAALRGRGERSRLQSEVYLMVCTYIRSVLNGTLLE